MDFISRLKLYLRRLLASDGRPRAGFSLEPLETRVLLSSTPIAVTEFDASASGFTAHFNQAADTTALSLTDTETGNAGPADITVVGATQGAVKGSLVVNGDQITFVKTGGALVPDVYTVTMRSASNGIKGIDGSLLDGNSDSVGGDNYLHTFTINAVTGPTVGIADFARGPGQVVQVPAPNNGVPISISDGSGVTSVELTLHYDPTLLKIVGIVLGAGLPAGSTVLSDLTVEGTLTLHITSPTAMASGPLELVRLLSEVPHTATYGATGLLDIDNLSINSGSMASTADDGMEAIAYFGEATGNRSYSALDGSRILRVVVGLDSGFAAYPFVDPVLMTDITGNGILSALDGTRILQEIVGLDRSEIEAITAVIQAELAHDSGISSTDEVTFDPSITGTARDDGAISSFNARVDTATPVDVTSDLINGSFNFSRARLEQILGGPLSEGTHTLSLQAVDNGGNVSTVSSFSFSLDTTLPSISALHLSAGSDTGTAGDNITAASTVVLTGNADPGSTLMLGGSPVLSTGAGTFQIPAVALNLGANSLTVVASDVAGNSTQANLIVTREGVITADVALQWNQQALEAIRLMVAVPPVATRVLAMVALAQYDTLAAIENTPAYLVQQTVVGPVSVDTALAKAAHTVLYALFPSLRAGFDTALNTLLGTIADGAARTNALALGLSVGNAVLAIRSQDGSDAFVDYPGSEELGFWRPTAPMFEVAEVPQWGDVTPFALTSPEEVRAVAPPTLDSAAYAQSVEEIRSLGGATSSARTADQTQTAQFWADGKGSYTPPGHWNQIAQQIALSKGNSLSSNVRLMAQLNMALADAAIAAWDTKYLYSLWRPIDAIHDAELDGNAATIEDNNWTPLLITPFHPEYVSGHSTFSSAAAAILGAAFGDNTAFSTTAFTLPGVTRSFASFTQAAEEAGRSRIYGGIHYEFTNQAGQVMGQQVAAAVLARFALNEDVQTPAVIADATPAATNTNVTLTGQILDNISGVAQAQFRVDTGALQTLVLDAQGHFTIATALALNGSNDGLHTITIQAKDAANNSAPLFTRTFTVDTLPPSITLDSIAEGGTIDASSRLTGTADPTGSNLTVLNYRFDNGVTRSVIFDNSTGSFDEQLMLGNLGVGTHTLTVSAKDAAGNESALTRNVTLAAATPLTILGVTPADGGSDVGSTYHPQVFFSKSIDKSTLNANNFFATDSAGNKLAATIVPAQDGSFAWLFFGTPMPGGETITVNVDGSTIHSQDGTQLLDADGDGVAGGQLQSRFTTVSLVPIPGTTITGRVIDPGLDLLPMTFDDIRRGPDGIIHTADDLFPNPLAGVKVFILGRESEFVFTDAQGRFTLTNVPAGNLKLAIDGRTATNAPAGIFFPEMVMDVIIEPGLPNTVMGSMGPAEEQRENESRDEVYLPRLRQSIMQTVSNTENTVVGVDANAAPDLTSEEAQHLLLTVPPNSAVDHNGQTITNVQIGVSTVPPELIRDMLPPGVMQLSNTITIQARGPNGETVDRFTSPIQLTFPNVYDAAPGTKLSFYSFDHTTGLVVIEGTATVSADGFSVTTDPGQGITKPGWHGVFPAIIQALLFDGLSEVLGLIGITWNPPPIVLMDGTGIQVRMTFDDGINSFEKVKLILAANRLRQIIADGSLDLHIHKADIATEGANAEAEMTAFSMDSQGIHATGDITLDSELLHRLVFANPMDSIGYRTGLHEMLHILGINGPNMERLGLIRGLDTDGDGKNDKFYFTGANAVQEYVNRYGTHADPNGIPLSSDGAHLDEASFPQSIISPVMQNRGSVPDVDSIVTQILKDIGHRLGSDSSESGNQLLRTFAPVDVTEDSTESALTIPASDWQFDFGVTSLPPQEGYLKVGAGTAYDSHLGFGWVGSPQSIREVGLGIGDSGDGAMRDLVILKSAGFRIDLVPGLYEVTMFIGDPAANHEQISVSAEGIRSLTVSQYKGEFAAFSFPVLVLDDSMNITIDAPNGVAIGAIHVSKASEGTLSSDVRTQTGNGSYAYLIENLTTGFTFRGRLDALSVGPLRSESLLLDARSSFRQTILNLETLAVGVSVFTTPSPGLIVRLPQTLLFPDSGHDYDGDGLSDIAEYILGTLSGVPDSDLDGLSDFAEMRAGTDPLGGRALPTGVVGSVSLRGEATDLVIEGSATSAETQTAYVATGSYGLAIVDVSQFRTPIVVSQLDLPGTATDVSVSPELAIAAVASNQGGVHLIDVSNPRQPFLLQTINIQGSSVEATNGVVYIAAGTQIVAYSLITGEFLFQSLMTSAVQDLSVVGNRLYALTSSRLHIFDIQTNALLQLGSVAVAGSTPPLESGRPLFVGDGVADVGHTQGYTIIDVSNPSAPVVTGTPPTTQPIVHDIAINGSGTAVTTTSFSGSSSFAVSLYDVSDPTDVTRFITTIPIPGDSPHVALGAGIAFVAQGTTLKVVNYLPFDANRIVPTVSIQADLSDLDPDTPGIQVLEGATIPVRALIQDDVQVRNVELLVNGVVQRNDVAYPFDMVARLPVIASGPSTATVQLRATDTGGNVGLSTLLTLNLVPDTIAPTLTASNITEGSIVGNSFRTVRLGFSETLDPGTFGITAVQIVKSDAQTFNAESVQFSRGGSDIQLTFSQLPLGNYTLRIDRSQVKDLAGNPMGSGFLDVTFVKQQFTIEWINPAGGNWNTPSNWSTGALPTATDDVYLGPAASVITLSTGVVTVQSLVTGTDFTLSGGSLTVVGSSQFNAVFRQSGGTFTVSGDAQVNGPFVFSGGTVQGIGELVLTGPDNQWSGGTMTGAGVTQVNSNLAITGNATKLLSGGRVLNLTATTTWSGNTAANSNVIQFNTGTINNTGTWNDANAFSTFFDQFSGTNAFNNTGTYNKQTNTATTFEPAFNNGNIVNVGGGSLILTGSGTHTGTFNVAGGATLNFNEGTHNLNNATVTGTGTLQVSGSTSFNFVNVNSGSTITTGALTLSGGNLTFNTDVVIGSVFTLSGGELGGLGKVTLNGTGNQWTGGTMTGAGITQVNSDLAISGNTTKFIFGGRVLNLTAATTWSGNTAVNSNLIRFGTGTINNSGTFNDANAFSASFDHFSGTNVFNNTGTYNKQSNTTTTVQIVFNSSSVVNISAGTLLLNGGGTAAGSFSVAAAAVLDFNSGTHNLNNAGIGGAGTLLVSGSTTFNFVNVNSGSTLTTAALTLSGGNLTFNVDAVIGSVFTFSGGELGGLGKVTLNGTGNQWTGGTMTGAGITQVNTDLAITGNATKFIFGGRVLNLTATTTWSGSTAANINLIRFGAGTINNSGTFNDANAFSASFDHFSGTNVFNNTGTYNKQSNTTTTVQIVFNNSSVVNISAGTLLLNGGGTAAGSFNVAAAAVLDFNSGTHNLNNAGIGGAGTLLVSGSTTFNFVNVNSGSALTTAALTLSGGNLTFNVDAVIGSVFTFSGGELGGLGKVTLNGTGNQWTGGTMTGAGITQVSSDLAITGNATKFIFGGRILNLTATTTWSGNTAVNSNLIQFGAGTINNSGTWNDANTLNTAFDHFSGTNAFNNTGTYNKQTNTTTTFEVAFSNGNVVNVGGGALILTGSGTHTGTFNVAAGTTLNLNAGTHNLNNAAVTGAGTLQVSGSTSFNFVNINSGSTITTAALTLSGGNLTFNVDAVIGSLFTFSGGVLGGLGTVTLIGTGNQWSGGTMSGVGITQVNSDLAITGSATKGLSGFRVLNLTGTTTWSGNTAANNNMIQFNVATINNSGTWNDTNTFNTVFDNFSGTSVFNDTGTYNKQTNTTTVFEIGFSNGNVANLNAGLLILTGGGTDTGSFNIAADAILDFNNGTHNLNSATIAGAGTLQVSGSVSFNFVNVNSGSTLATSVLTLSGGTTTFNADVVIPSVFTFSGGELRGLGKVTLNGTGNQWSGGTMTGAGITQVNSNLAITGNATKVLSGFRVLNLTGTTTWSGNTAANNNMIQFNVATINNSGTWNDNNTFNTLFDNFSGTSVFNNTGTYNKQTTTTTVFEIAFSNGNVANLNAGSLILTAGGTHTGNFSTQLGGSVQFNGGTHNISGGSATGAGEAMLNGAILNISSAYSISRLNFSSGTLSGAGTVTITGTGSQWAGGTMTGGGTTQIAAGADFTISGTGIKTLGNRTIQNEGTLTDASTAGRVELDGIAVLNNVGLFDVRNGATNTSWDHASGVVGSLTINNSGILRKSLGTADFLFNDSTLNNTGTIEILAGRILVNGVLL